MPMNNFSIGKDVSIDIYGQVNGVLSPDLITKFDSKQDTNSVKIKGLDGVTRHLEIPDGWSGSLEMNRGSGVMDDYFAALEANYYAGSNVQAATITETITEPDGSISQYRYTGVMFKYSDAGSKVGDGDVKLKLDWVASKRIKVI